MKKIILLSILFMSSIMFLCAQTTNVPLFPPTKGAKLETKTYDANDKLLYSMNYYVVDADLEDSDGEMKITYTLEDATGKMVNEGQITASYEGGIFSMDMRNKTLIPDVLDLLGSDTELVGGLLDYPNTFDPNFPYNEDDMQLDDIEYMLQSKSDKKDFLRVNIFDRQIHKNEKITTPAGTFDAGKITYKVKVEKGKEEMYYNGTEWYTFGTGILRIEITDRQNNLLNYTVLTSITQ